MTDVFSKQKRSEIMSLIRSQNTAIEAKVFRFLRKNDIYFQKHYKRAVGSPDIALPRKKIAIFIDGDFWHGWKFKKSKLYSSGEYWRPKIESNILRDRATVRRLKREGWKVLRIWEHDLKKKEKETLEKIKRFLAGS